MPNYKAVFFAGTLYQGQPVPIQWAIDGPSQAASATVRVLIGGQTLWSTTASLPMPTSRIDSLVPQRSDLAHRLFDIPIGSPIPHGVRLDMIISIDSGGLAEEVLVSATTYVYPPLPFLRFEPISPGQPIAAAWGLDTTGANPRVPYSTFALASIELSVTNSAGQDVVVQPKTDAVYINLGNSNDSVQDHFAISDANLSGIIYKKGTHLIKAKIVLILLDYEQTFETTADLSVTLEAVDASWWQWTVPGHFRSDRGYPYSVVGWNNGYNIGGRLSNKSEQSVFIASVELAATDLWGELPVPTDPLTPIGSMTIGPLQPQESNSFGDVIISGQNQNYVWLNETEGGFSPSAASVVISYFAKFSLTDSFANIYPETLSSEISIDVSVPDSKLAAATAATVLLVTVVFCTIGAGIAVLAGGIPGAIVAAVLSGAAVIAGIEFAQQIANAKDPPSPNRSFAQPVAQPPARFPTALGRDTKFVGLRNLMLAVHLIGRTHAARSEILSRLMGARIERDTRALQMQHTYYMTLIERLRRRVQLIPSFAAVASLELKQSLIQEFRDEWSRRIVESQASGLAPDLKEALKKLKVTQKLMRQVDAAVSNAGIATAAQAATAASDPGEIEPIIKLISDAMTTLSESLLAEADTVLSDAMAATRPGTAWDS